MNLKAKFLQGSFILSGGFAFQQAVLFLRNILVARLVGPDEFGVLVTFIIVISALELASDLGVELYIIRAPNGDQPVLQSTLHTVLVFRGLLLGLAIFLVGDLAAHIFQVPEAAWAYRALALVSIIRGFLHLDPRRMQRNLSYFPTITITLAGTVTATIVAIVLAYCWRSYNAMVWAYIADATAMVVASHLLAKRKYRLGGSRKELSALLKYGLPLLLNGVVLFLMGQGDRSIIGTELGVRELANYAVAAMLSAGPTMLIIKVSGALFLPLLSGENPGSTTFARRYDWCGALTALAALPIVVLFIFYGVPLVSVLYGHEYDVSIQVFAWLSIVAGARILRSWPQAASLAIGSTRDVLIANALPVLGFVGALFALRFGFGTEGVAASIAGGETIALFYALERSDRQAKTGRHEGWKLGVLFLLVATASMMAVNVTQPGFANLTLLLSAIALVLLVVVCVVGISNSVRLWLERLVTTIRRSRMKDLP